jgi:capsule polysaccharide export protein KpsE/RkpR
MEPLEKSMNQTDQVINMVNQTIEIANRLKAEKEALRAENTRLKEALEDLMSYQNGPPLVSYEKGWTAAMQKAEELLNPKPL